MKWHTPIGYRIRNGQIVIDKEKAKVVQQIFAEYDSGVSTTKIAKRLKERGISNNNDKVIWTHVKVGNILENNIYIGTEIYSQIIEPKIFESVQIKREQKRKRLGRGKYRLDEKERKMFGGIIICGECGGNYSHLQPKDRRYGVAKWVCKNYAYKNKIPCEGGFISDKEVMEICTKSINQLIENRMLFQKKENEKGQVNLKCLELERKNISIEDEDSNDRVKLLYQRAAERYRSLEIRADDIYTSGMEELLKEMKPLGDFNEQLYRKLVKKIIVCKNNTAYVIFQNGISIENKYGET